MTVEPDPWGEEEISPDPWVPAEQPEEPSLLGSAKKLAKSFQRMFDDSIPSQGAHYDAAATITGGLIPGALGYTAGMRAIPALAKSAKILPRVLKHALGGAAGGAAAVGATGGDWEDVGEGAVTGAALGPVTGAVTKIPGPLKMMKTIKGAVTGKRPEQLATKALGNVFGERSAEAAAAARGLRSNVPGEQLSIGYAATPRLPEFAALERVTRGRPGLNALTEMDDATRMAQEAALLRYAKPAQPPRAAMGESNPLSPIAVIRRAKTQPKYDALQNKRVPFTRPMKEAAEGAEVYPLASKAAKAQDQLRANARAQGVPQTPPRQFSVSVGEGQGMLRQIDEKLRALDTGLVTPADKAMKARLQEARRIINGELEKGSSDFAKVNRQYGKLMVADRQTNTVNELLTQLRKGPTQYLGALDDPATVLKNAGATKQTQLEQVLSPKQLNAVEGVGKTLRTKKDVAKLGAAEGNLAKYKNVFDIAAENTPGVFSQGYTIFRKAMQRLGATSDEQIQEVIDKAVADPKMMAKLLQGVPSAKQKYWNEMFRNLTSGALVGATVPEGVNDAP